MQAKFDRKFLFTIAAVVESAEGDGVPRTIVYFPKIVNGVIVGVEPECYTGISENPAMVPISAWEMQYMFGVAKLRSTGDVETRDGGKTTKRNYQMKINAVPILPIYVSHEVHCGKHGTKEKFKIRVQYNGKSHNVVHASAVVSRSGPLSGVMRITLFDKDGAALILPDKEIPSDMIMEYIAQQTTKM